MDIFAWFRRPSPEIQAAKALIQAIDRGGIPSNPAKVNDIARRLGLEVSRSAPMSDTIERIRTALKRSSSRRGAV
jgi:hypothetical protein